MMSARLYTNRVTQLGIQKVAPIFLAKCWNNLHNNYDIVVVPMSLNAIVHRRALETQCRWIKSNWIWSINPRLPVLNRSTAHSMSNHCRGFYFRFWYTTGWSMGSHIAAHVLYLRGRQQSFILQFCLLWRQSFVECSCSRMAHGKCGQVPHASQAIAMILGC